MSAVLADDPVMSVFSPGDHGSTFGGNPLGAAVATRALEVLEEEQLVEQAFALGGYVREQLRRLNSPRVKEVRGKGLLIGVEIKEEYGPARGYCEKLMELGILCKETRRQVIRLAPPPCDYPGRVGLGARANCQRFGLKPHLPEMFGRNFPSYTVYVKYSKLDGFIQPSHWPRGGILWPRTGPVPMICYHRKTPIAPDP